MCRPYIFIDRKFGLQAMSVKITIKWLYLQFFNFIKYVLIYLNRTNQNQNFPRLVWILGHTHPSGNNYFQLTNSYHPLLVGAEGDLLI